MNDWYGCYESHEPDEPVSMAYSLCRIGLMVLSENNTDEDHDVLHQCGKENKHESLHKCGYKECGLEF